MVVKGDGSANKPFDFLSEDKETENQETEDEDEEMNFEFAEQQTGNSNMDPIDLTESTDDENVEEMEEETDKENCMSLEPPQEFWNAQLYFHQATSTYELPFGGYFLRKAWCDLFESEHLNSNFMARVTNLAENYVNAYIYNWRQDSALQENQLAVEYQQPMSTVVAAACHDEANTSKNSTRHDDSDVDSTIVPPLIPRTNYKNNSDDSDDEDDLYHTEESSEHIKIEDELNEFNDKSEVGERTEKEKFMAHIPHCINHCTTAIIAQLKDHFFR